jgi:pyruvate dehydrogenase E2 component (dihydrolipoamide acetyltransferase)
LALVADAQPLSVKGEVRIEEPSAAQRTVARRTAEARATIPHVELSIEIEMAAALAWRERERCSVTALLVRACALALNDVPYANGAYRDGRFELYSRINVGVVVAAEDVYVIPTVFDADQKTPAELTGELDDLRRRARERTLPAPAFSGATFTLWNAGAHGLSSASIVVTPGQSCALAFGVIHDGARRPMTATLACDHRILYGQRAARFLGAIRSCLES